MEYLRKLSKTTSLICAFGSLYIILTSIIVILREHIVPLYWDEWEIGLFLLSRPAWPHYLTEIASPQNEHIIAPTKILLLADYYLFSLTNLPLVLFFVILAATTAYLLSRILFYGQPSKLGQLLAASVFLACGLSLVQYENLLWGFQSQFEFVLVGALTSITLAIRITEQTERPSTPQLILLCLSIGFCILSMGSGVAIPVCVLFVLLARGASRKQLSTVILASTIFLSLFAYQTRHSVAVGDPALKTPANIAQFFLTMIGSPLTSEVDTAMPLGLFLFVSLSTLFGYFIIWPRLRSRPLDGGLIGLFAFTGFLFVSAAGAAWGRTSLGLLIAMSSRYATPMLLLWMMLFAIPIRTWIIGERPSLHRQAGQHICLLAALSLVAWTDFMPSVTERLLDFVTPLNEAAYFLASGADDAKVSKLYPVPSEVRETIAFLRAKRLNMFAQRFGLDRPNIAGFNLHVTSRPTTACAAAAIDKVAQADKDTWAVSGWAADAALKTPKWILAIDPTGKVLGYTRPMSQRNDVTEAIGAERGFRGFDAPVHLTDRTQKGFSLIASTKDGSACVVKNLDTPLRGLLPIALFDLAPIDAKLSQAGAVARPGIPSILHLRAPYPGADVVGTWATADSNVGSLTLEVADPLCKGVYLPVVRGPSSNGQTLTVYFAGGHRETAAIDAMRPHDWALFKIGPAPSCKASADNDIRIVLRDDGQGWGEWSALAMPGVPK